MQFFPSPFFVSVFVGAVFGVWGYLKSKRARYCLVGIIGVVLGCFYVPFYSHLVASGNVLPPLETAFQGTVLRTSRMSEKSQTIVISLLGPFRGMVDVVTAPLPEFRYGDILSFQGGPMRDGDNGHPFLAYPVIERMGEGGGSPIKQFLIGIRDRVRESFLTLLPKDSAALLGGITLGIRADFSDVFKQAMARSGTTHLVALSGYNVAILGYALFLLFGSWLPKRATLVLTTLVIIAFVLMVGAEASVVRAAVMGILLILAQGVGRLYNPRNTITFAAAVMLVQDPMLIGFDVGFLLSFVSLCGVIYLAPALETLFRLKKEKGDMFNWRGAFTTTLAAQLAVVPILLAYFGGVSLVGIFTNVLLLEIVPFVMVLGCFLGILASIAMPLAHIVTFLVEVPLLYMRSVIYFFSSLGAPYGANLFSAPLAALYYTILIGVILYADEKRRATP